MGHAPLFIKDNYNQAMLCILIRSASYFTSFQKSLYLPIQMELSSLLSSQSGIPSQILSIGTHWSFAHVNVCEGHLSPGLDEKCNLWHFYGKCVI